MAENICKTVQYGMRPRPDVHNEFLERAFVGLYTEVDLRHADDADVARGIVKADTFYKQALGRFAESAGKTDWWGSVASEALKELDALVELESDAKVKSGMALYMCARSDFITLKMVATEAEAPAPAIKLEAELAIGNLGRGISKLVEKARAL